MKNIHAVGTIIENTNSEILVLKRHENDPEGGTWGLAGGKVDPGETAEEAAVRETYEELGLETEADRLVFVKSYRWDREDISISFDVFSYQLTDVPPEFVLPENEITDVMWQSPQLLLERDDLMVGLYEILEDLLS